ncbi:MAG: hypothetical protein ABWY50_01955 [Aeromicrobium sp.]
MDAVTAWAVAWGVPIEVCEAESDAEIAREASRRRPRHERLQAWLRPSDSR